MTDEREDLATGCFILWSPWDVGRPSLPGYEGFLVTVQREAGKSKSRSHKKQQIIMGMEAGKK